MTRRKVNTPWLLLMSSALAAGGCANSGPIRENPAGFPEPLTIELRSYNNDGRQAYYELEDDGTLRFGGGRYAAKDLAEPVGTLKEQQRAALWRIIRDRQLLDGSGSTFATPQRIKYELKVRAGARRASYRAIDDEVQGLADLDAALFEMQSEMRFSDLFRAIDDRIERAGGVVPKR